MKKSGTVKGFFSGVIMTVLIVFLIGTTLASTGTFDLKATYRDIKLYVDGLLVTPKDAAGNVVEPFLYNGTVYLPARALANSLGESVEWKNDINTVYIGTIPGSSNYSRTAPAPMGTEQTIAIDTYSNKYAVSMKINRAYRGIDAWGLIQAANRFNSPAPAGKEYIYFEMTAVVLNSADDKFVDFSRMDIDAFSSSNVEYDYSSVADDLAFDGEVYTGGTLTGWVAILVDQTDINPKITYGRNYDGTGGIWFYLSEAA